MRQLVTPLRSRLNIFRHAKIRVFLPYALCTIVAFVALAFLDNRLNKISFTWHLVILLVLCLVFGALNVWTLENRWFKDHSALFKTLLTFGANLLGGVLFILVAREVSFKSILPAYQWAFLPALCLFSFPWVFYKTIFALLAIPKLRYEPFVFESLKDVLAEYRFAEFRDRGIRWVFEGSFPEVSASDDYGIRTHLPLDFKQTELGMLFKGVLSFHNHNLVPQRPIHFHKNEQFYGWVFEHNPYWFLPHYRRAIDPQRIIRRCRLRFQRISEEERIKSPTKLTSKFRAATIYISRTNYLP